MAKWMALILGSVPLVGWCLNLLYNGLLFGNPFASREWSSVPLAFATLPCLHIWNDLARSDCLRGHHIIVQLCYVLFCVGAYGLTGFVLGKIVEAWIHRNRKRKQ